MFHYILPKGPETFSIHTTAGAYQNTNSNSEPGRRQRRTESKDSCAGLGLPLPYYTVHLSHDPAYYQHAHPQEVVSVGSSYLRVLDKKSASSSSRAWTNGGTVAIMLLAAKCHSRDSEKLSNSTFIFADDALSYIQAVLQRVEPQVKYNPSKGQHSRAELSLSVERCFSSTAK